jgi:hypothetical protein
MILGASYGEEVPLQVRTSPTEGGDESLAAGVPLTRNASQKGLFLSRLLLQLCSLPRVYMRG